MISKLLVITCSVSVKLKAFSKFENTTEALSALTGIADGKIPSNLSSFLQKELSKKDLKDQLAVADSKLGKKAFHL
jgi:nucleolar protein 58